eukprot:scaffold1055_cov165-Amphora_coffeaeformis.AAC.16
MKVGMVSSVGGLAVVCMSILDAHLSPHSPDRGSSVAGIARRQTTKIMVRDKDAGTCEKTFRAGLPRAYYGDET